MSLIFESILTEMKDDYFDLKSKLILNFWHLLVIY